MSAKFTKRSSKNDVKKTKNKESVPDKVGKRFICDLCDKSYLSKQGINFHLKNFHLNEAIKEHPDGMQCGFGGCKEFVLKDNYDEHIKQKHKKRECGICKRVFFNYQSFYQHKKTHEALKFSCDICKHKSITKQVLEKHILTLHLRPEPRTECKQCGKMIAIRSLQRHINQVHQNQRDFKCAVCKKGFYTRTYLRQHLAEVHLERKNYVCPIEKCQRTFTQSGNLKLHLKKHDKRPLNCQKCPRSFETEKTLRRHHDINHVNPKVMHLCHRCDKQFSARSSLDVHITAQHLKLKFKCDICGKEYMQKESLKQHLMKQHVEKA